MKVSELLKVLHHYSFERIITIDEDLDIGNREKCFEREELLELFQMCGEYEITFISNSTKHPQPNLELYIKESKNGN